MRIPAIILLVLVISQTYALTKKSSSLQAKQIEALKKDNTWSKIVLTLAELHMMSDFPLADLVDAVEQLVVDLQQKSEVEQQVWQSRTDDHHATVGRLTGQIESSVTDISNATDNLENRLYPRKRDLEEIIRQSNENIVNNNNRLAEIHTQRENDHNAYVVRVEEHNNAVAALDEAVGLLQSLVNGSFVQVKFAKQNLQKIANKLGKHLHETLAQALVSLATSEFADSKVVRDVIEKLQNIKNNISQSLVDEQANEVREQQLHDEETARLEQNNVDNNIRIVSSQLDLDSTNYNIHDEENFKAQREADLAGQQADLKSENEHYDEETNVHNDLAAQLVSEVNAASEALSILHSGEFSDYINKRIYDQRAQ